MIVLIGYILFKYQRKHNNHKKGLELLKSEFERTLLSTQLEIQEQTFQNISSEIHDNIGLSLTLAKLNLNTIQWDQTAQTKDKVMSSVDFISKAMDDLNYISKTLHTGFIEENGLWVAVDLEIKKIKKLNLFAIHYKVTGSPIYMKTPKELVIFRIIQEVLNNSIKHSQATTIQVQLHYMDDHVKVVLTDNGKGFTMPEEKQARKGTGLMNIVQRATLIEGRCEVTSQPGKGTSVTMHVPY